jgi:hypothetical protein
MGQPRAAFTAAREADAGQCLREPRRLEGMIAAVLHVLRQQVSLPKSELIRESALVLGFQRTGGMIQRIVGQAIDQALQGKAVCADDDGRVRLSS